MPFANYRLRTPIEIIDESLQIFRAHAGVLMSIAALVMVPPAVIAFFLPESAAALVDKLANLLFPIGQGAMSVAAFEMLGGNEISVADAYKQIGNRIGTLIGSQIVTGFLTILGLLLLIVPGVLVLIWTSVVIPVVAMEGVGVSAAIERSRQLTTAHKRHVFFTAAMAIVISIVVFIAIGVALAILGAMVTLSDRAGELLATIAVTLMLPIWSIALTFLYVDLRVRVEGADIAELATAT